MTQIRHFTQLLTNCLGKTCKTPRTKDIRSLRVKEYIQNLFFPYTVVSARFVPKQKLSPLEILIFLKKKGGGEENICSLQSFLPMYNSVQICL